MNLRGLYIILFAILGAISGFFVHGLTEIVYIKFLVSDYSSFSFGISYRSIKIIHAVFLFVFVVSGAHVGYLEGKYWWEMIYESNRKSFFKKLFHKNK